MRLKRLGGTAPELPNLKKNSLCKSFCVELITPLYGGGVEAGKPDKDMPIRAASIRGQLRFWWRVLNPTATLAKEQEIWGGMGEKEAVASRVKVRVTELKPEKPEPKPCAKHVFYLNKKGGESFKLEWLPDLIPQVTQSSVAYALFTGQGEAKKDKNTQRYQTIKPPHDVFLPSLKFTLEVQVENDSLWSDVLPALRWWASFGGVGARTRRGLGSVKVEGLNPVAEAEIPKGLYFVPHPVKAKSAIDAWTIAVGRLQKFRQGTDKGEGRNPGIGNRPGRSYWPEADSVRKMTGYHFVQTYKPTKDRKPAIQAKDHSPIHPVTDVEPHHAFPRAVFGLPIIMDFPNDSPKAPKGKNPRPIQDKDPLKTTLTPIYQGKLKERMSSPLILKAMWMGDDNYRAIALLLPNYTCEMGLHIEYNENKNLKSKERFSEDMNTSADWYSPKAKNVMVNPLPKPDDQENHTPVEGLSGDILQDFLTFFAKGEK